MADNTTINAGSGGDVISTDDVGGGVKVQRVKIQHGADGSATDVSTASPLPVSDAGSTLSIDDGSGSITVDGSVTATVGSALPAGNNNIGDVDIASIPAVDRTTDNIGAVLTTDAIMSDTTVLTPKFAVIDAATSGDNTLVAAVSSKKIRVLSLFIVNGHTSTQTVRFESGASGTALTGQMILAANGGFVLPFNPVGWFETATTTLLNLELSGATTVDGSLCYVEV